MLTDDDEAAATARAAIKRSGPRFGEGLGAVLVFVADRGFGAGLGTLLALLAAPSTVWLGGILAHRRSLAHGAGTASPALVRRLRRNPEGQV